jgi:mRNA interferase MazF
MLRGDIILVSLEPTMGSEAAKTRPAIIVSSNAANDSAHRRGHGVITIVPLTSNVRRVYPFQAFLPATSTGLDRDSKAQAEQVRSVDTERIVAVLGHVSDERLREVDDALRLHLSL